jgi:hypothetical protein
MIETGKKQYANVEVLSGPYTAKEGDVVVASAERAFLAHKEVRYAPVGLENTVPPSEVLKLWNWRGLRAWELKEALVIS